MKLKFSGWLKLTACLGIHDGSASGSGKLETQAKTLATSAKREAQVIDRKIEQLVERLVQADSPTIIQAYEDQLQRLQDQKNLMAEKMAARHGPKKSFEETFRTLFKFLSNPRILWNSGCIKQRRKMLRLLFGQRLAYSKNESFRTPQTTPIFKALQQISMDDSGMAHRGRFELPTPRFVV